MEAENTHAVERYLLGEMNEAETESFELHYFECAACAVEVETGTIFKENVQAAFAYAPEPPPAVPWWRQWSFAAPAFAALVLAVVTIFQTGWVIPALRQEVARLQAPQPVPAMAVPVFAVRSMARGEKNVIAVPPGARSFVVNLDLPDDQFPRYQCELRAPSGSPRWAFNTLAPPPGSPLCIVISTAGLQPGIYTLKVHGVSGGRTGPEINYSFRL